MYTDFRCCAYVKISTKKNPSRMRDNGLQEADRKTFIDLNANTHTHTLSVWERENESIEVELLANRDIAPINENVYESC